MTKLPSMPLWVDDLSADTQHLTDAQLGLYLRLLILIWKSPQCRIPNDDDWLARHLRKPAAKIRKEVRPLIDEFCKPSGNWITHVRLLDEQRYIRKKVEKNRASANARWSKEKKPSERTATAHANAMLPTPTPTSKPTPIREQREALSPQFGGNSIHDPSSPIASSNQSDRQSTSQIFVPEHWRPSQDDQQFAMSKGWNAEHIDHVAQKFRTYYGTRPIPRGTDISGAWRMWVLREQDKPRDNTPRVAV